MQFFLHMALFVITSLEEHSSWNREDIKEAFWKGCNKDATTVQTSTFSPCFHLCWKHKIFPNILLMLPMPHWERFYICLLADYAFSISWREILYEGYNWQHPPLLHLQWNQGQITDCRWIQGLDLEQLNYLFVGKFQTFSQVHHLNAEINY